MLAAKSIAYARTGASGIIAAKLMERLGLAEQLKDKTKLVDGVPVAEVVAKGEAEIGMQQINVILPVAGAERRSAAGGAAGLCRFRHRRARHLEGTRRRAGTGEVHVVARSGSAHP